MKIFHFSEPGIYISFEYLYTPPKLTKNDLYIFLNASFKLELNHISTQFNFLIWKLFIRFPYFEGYLYNAKNLEIWFFFKHKNAKVQIHIPNKYLFYL